MMAVRPKLAYTPQFQDAAVKQVPEGGRSIASIARSLEKSTKLLANRVTKPARARP